MAGPDWWTLNPADDALATALEPPPPPPLPGTALTNPSPGFRPFPQDLTHRQAQQLGAFLGEHYQPPDTRPWYDQVLEGLQQLPATIAQGTIGYSPGDLDRVAGDVLRGRWKEAAQGIAPAILSIGPGIKLKPKVAAGPRIATGGQWLATLKNAGIDANDMRIIEPWLAERANQRLAKEDVLGAFRQQAPKLKTVWLGAAPEDLRPNMLNARIEEIIRQSQEGLIDKFEAERRINAIRAEAKGTPGAPNPKFQSYLTKPKGANYREMLVQLEDAGFVPPDAEAAWEETHKLPQGTPEHEAALDRYARLQVEQDYFAPGRFTASHWGEHVPDVLSSALLSDRTMAAGEQGYGIFDPMTGERIPEYADVVFRSPQDALDSVAELLQNGRLKATPRLAGEAPRSWQAAADIFLRRVGTISPGWVYHEKGFPTGPVFATRAGAHQWLKEHGVSDVDAHVSNIRPAETAPPAGERVLDLEEIQSDWHQKARDLRKAMVRDLAKRENISLEEAAKRVPEDAGYLPAGGTGVTRAEISDAFDRVKAAYDDLAKKGISNSNRVEYSPLSEGEDYNSYVKGDVVNGRLINPDNLVYEARPGLWVATTRTHSNTAPGGYKLTALVNPRAYSEGGGGWLDYSRRRSVDAVLNDPEVAKYLATGATPEEAWWNVYNWDERGSYALPDEVAAIEAYRNARRDVQKLKDRGTRTGRQTDEYGYHLFPNAPYKGLDWVDPTLSRVVQYAADNGYPGVTWPQGDVVNERYSYGTHASRIVYEHDTPMVRLIYDPPELRARGDVPHGVFLGSGLTPTEALGDVSRNWWADHPDAKPTDYRFEPVGGTTYSIRVYDRQGNPAFDRSRLTEPELRELVGDDSIVNAIVEHRGQPTKEHGRRHRTSVGATADTTTYYPPETFGTPEQQIAAYARYHRARQWLADAPPAEEAAAQAEFQAAADAMRDIVPGWGRAMSLPQEQTIAGEISGAALDRRIGEQAKGNQGFYDRIMPAKAAKLFGKYGAKAERRVIDLGQRPLEDIRTDVVEAAKARARQSGAPMSDELRAANEAYSASNVEMLRQERELGVNTRLQKPVWYLPITTALREQARLPEPP